MHLNCNASQPPGLRDISEAFPRYDGNVDLLQTREDTAAILTVNRPERRNALSLDLMRRMIGALDRIGADPEVRAVIVASEGSVFCSGHDLSEMTGRGEEDYRLLFDTCTKLMLRLQEIPQPVIAQVQGVATAAGCQLVAACDLAVASETASFATPGVRIGLFCTTPMIPLVRAIGRKRALEMLLTGCPVGAATAAEWGLVNRVVPAAGLKRATLDLAARIAEASSFTVGLGKAAFYKQHGLTERAAYDIAIDTMCENALAGDAQEGISAFLGKRAPRWSGR